MNTSALNHCITANVSGKHLQKNITIAKFNSLFSCFIERAMRNVFEDELDGVFRRNHISPTHFKEY